MMIQGQTIEGDNQSKIREAGVKSLYLRVEILLVEAAWSALSIHHLDQGRAEMERGTDG